MSVITREQPQARRIPWVPLGIGAAVILLALGLWAYTRTRPETATVTRQDIVVTLPLEGEVVAPPLARADIRAPYQAPVARVFASVGDPVSQGDVLVELTHPTAQVAYDQAQRELQAARAAYEQARQQYSATLNQARQQLETARATERRAREAAAASQPAVGEEAIAAVQQPAMSLAEATEARLEAERAVLQAEAEVENALAPYQQRLEAAQAAFQDAQSGRKVAMIRTPIAGTVLALNARPGEEIGADREALVATVVDLGELQVHAGMSDEEAGAIHRGAPVTLTFNDLAGQTFEGKIDQIVTEPARPLQGQQQVAIVEFRNEKGLVKPEMKARAAVRLGQTNDALAVPSDAVDRDEQGRPAVEVLRNGRWQEVVVEPGLSDGQYTAIRTGLKEGETVRVTPDLL
jgi:multidrug efflux pump subunit AcrA (membrane-fusion protein)